AAAAQQEVGGENRHLFLLLPSLFADEVWLLRVDAREAVVGIADSLQNRFRLIAVTIDEMDGGVRGKGVTLLDRRGHFLQENRPRRRRRPDQRQLAGLAAARLAEALAEEIRQRLGYLAKGRELASQRR